MVWIRIPSRWPSSALPHECIPILFRHFLLIECKATAAYNSSQLDFLLWQIAMPRPCIPKGVEIIDNRFVSITNLRYRSINYIRGQVLKSIFDMLHVASFGSLIPRPLGDEYRIIRLCHAYFVSRNVADANAS